MKKVFYSLFVLFMIPVTIVLFSSNTLYSQTDGHNHAPGESCSADAPAGIKQPEQAVAVDPHAGHNHAPVPTPAADPHAGHDHGAPSASAAVADPHAGHDHAAHANVGSTPIEELYKPECEHKIKTIDCDECRYELGAVKMTDQLGKMLKTQVLSQSTSRKEIAFRGELEYDNQLFRTVTSVVPGIITSMPVRKGDLVEQGQVIAIIESRELSHTALELQKQIAELGLAQKKLAREEMLNEKKVGAMQSVQEARAARELIALEINCSKEQLALFGLSSSEIAAIAAGKATPVQKGRLQITSPIQGRVVAINANIGSAVNEQQPLAEIVNIQQLRAIGQIKESDIPAVLTELKKGNLNGYISTQAFPGSLYPVRAVSADAALKAATRMLEIQLTVKNPDELLRPGMFIEGTLEIGSAASKPALPASAVLEDDNRHFVFVKHDGKMLFRRDVTIEGQQGDTVFIGSGLQDGAEIVTEGSFLLKSDILRAKMGAGCSH